MKYALLGLLALVGCEAATELPEPANTKDPVDTAVACTKGASTRIAMGEPKYIIYKECTIACQETWGPELCEDRVKSFIELAESSNNLHDALN